MKRLYVVVRADLPLGLQMAQACHAAREFTLKYPSVDVGENLVVLQVPGESDLQRLAWSALARAHVHPFFEPDMKWQMTAAAFCGDARKLLSSLPLAGKPCDSSGLSVLTT